jgi:hypothetical protein
MPEFISGLQEIIRNTNNSNDLRAAAVEEYILQQAVKAQVVKEIKITIPKNPNKWGKTLAPWFNEECREAKKLLSEARKLYGKGDERVIQAIKKFHKVCIKGRLEFAKTTPDMLKY